MSDRRQFLRGASVIGVASWCKGLLAQSQDSVGATQANEITPSNNISTAIKPDAIVLENAELRLVINANGSAHSLIHKPTGQECLAKGTGETMFNVTQYRPYDNELQLAYPAKLTQFAANQVQRKGDSLIVRFENVGYEATIGIKITNAYIAFRLEGLKYIGYTHLRPKEKTPLDETVFIQLPILDRKNLGEWLNVMWDDKVAVNLLGTDPVTQIDAKARAGYHLFQAGTLDEVQLEGAGAALITTTPSQLLDRIAQVEEDFDLPRGVESRRREESKYSYYQAMSMKPTDIERQVHFAKMGGFRLMSVYCMSFSETVGHFPWRKEYSRGMEDLKDAIAKISDAGIIPGLHILYTMANEMDPYVSGEPDPRLNLFHSFTLAESVDAAVTSIPVEESPRLCTMAEGKRIIRIQNELISYKRYSTKPPYQFEGCERGVLSTKVASHERSSRVGLLDMYGGGPPEWLFMRFAQNTSLQAEVAERLQEIYKQAKFKFMYFDGAEQVPAPYWYTIPLAQKIMYEKLQPLPLFSEGSCKAHFSWHMISRGNAFDTAVPEEMKGATRAYPATEIQKAVNDFTRINFGWVGYWSPSEKTIGTQPDMLEYITSRAAAWDCPISLSQGSPDLVTALELHPRTPDNMEVIRRWEEVRAKDWLTEAQKVELRNLDQEHTLLINEHGKFELVPWEQIEIAGSLKGAPRGFIFEREGSVMVAYWHCSGEGTLDLSLGIKQMTLMRELGKSLQIKGNAKDAKLPLGERRYLKFHNLSRQQVTAAFQEAKVL